MRSFDNWHQWILSTSIDRMLLILCQALYCTMKWNDMKPNLDIPNTHYKEREREYLESVQSTSKIGNWRSDHSARYDELQKYIHVQNPMHRVPLLDRSDDPHP